MRERRTFIIVGLILIVASLALAAFMLQPSAQDLLINAAEAMELTAAETTTGHAVVEFSVDAPDMAATGTMEVWGRMGAGPEGEPAFRAEVLSASRPEVVGMVAVSDGSQFWLWNPAENKVLTGTNEEMRAFIEAQMAAREGQFGEYTPEDFGQHEDFATGEHPETAEEAVNKLLEYFTAERTGIERVGQDGAYALRLIPIPEQMPDEIRAAGGLVQVWLRTSDNLPLGAAYTGGAFGEGQVQATTLELNVELADTLFTFAIPEGATVESVADLEPQTLSPAEAATQADFDVLEPAVLPADATLVEVVDLRGAIVQRYNQASGGSFTIAQGPAGAAPLPDGEGQPVDVRGTSGTLFTDDTGNRTLLTWQEGEVSIWIGGDLTAEQVQALADSLE
jgi:outer membrane lipoprotein-sorting protein